MSRVTRREVDMLIKYYNDQARDVNMPEVLLDKYDAELPYRLYRKLNNGVSEIPGLGRMTLHDVYCSLWGMIFLLENVTRNQ